MSFYETYIHIHRKFLEKMISGKFNFIQTNIKKLKFFVFDNRELTDFVS